MSVKLPVSNLRSQAASLFAGAVFGLATSSALAQTDPLQLQTLGQVQDAQDQRHAAAEQAAAAARQAAAEAQADSARRQLEHIEQQERAVAAAQRNAVIAAQKRADARAAEQAREKAADDDYLAQKRALDLKEREIELKMQAARANHADDFARAELKRDDTETDTVAATNEGIRNVSSAVRDKADAEGKAAKMKQRHWWQWWD